jgi:hypothetical protein
MICLALLAGFLFGVAFQIWREMRWRKQEDRDRMDCACGSDAPLYACFECFMSESEDDGDDAHREAGPINYLLANRHA